MAQQRMARMQILMPHTLKADLETYADRRELSLNEAVRILLQLGLGQSRDNSSASQMAAALLERVRAMEETTRGADKSRDAA